jgi:hypothetical protein
MVRRRTTVMAACVVLILAACSSDDDASIASTTSAPITTDMANTTVANSTPAASTTLDPSAAANETSESGTTNSGASVNSDDTSASVDTRYLDLYLEQGVLTDPFYPDALGGDINFDEAACTNAANDLASFGAARGDVDAAGVLASLAALSADLPSNFEPALLEWERFIADHSDAYSGPFFPVSQGARDEATLRTALTDPAVVSMLDAYQQLDLVPPQDFIEFLNASCTPVEVGVEVTTG